MSDFIRRAFRAATVIGGLLSTPVMAQDAPKEMAIKFDCSDVDGTKLSGVLEHSFQTVYQQTSNDAFPVPGIPVFQLPYRCAKTVTLSGGKDGDKPLSHTEVRDVAMGGGDGVVYRHAIRTHVDGNYAVITSSRWLTLVQPDDKQPTRDGSYGSYEGKVTARLWGHDNT